MLARGWRDVALAGAFATWAVVEIAAHVVHGAALVAVPSALLATVPMAWRRSAPVAAALACAGGLTLQTALGIPLSGMAITVAAAVAAYSVGRHACMPRAAWTVAGMVVLLWLALFGLPQRSAGDYVFTVLFIAAPGVAGAALRVRIHQVEQYAARAARAELQREEHARMAVQSERVRIARELHDIIAHTVSVMVLHTGAVRSRLPEGLAADRAALEQAERAGREAIGELRRLLGVLRDDAEPRDDAPQPTLRELTKLADDARSAGLDVEVRIEGRPRPLDPGVEVSAYRIVQEALTNVRKHARARCAAVCVGYDGDWLRLHVSDNGVGAASTEAAGFGLLGIRERVDVYGGRLTMSTAPGAGFTLDVALPVHPA